VVHLAPSSPGRRRVDLIVGGILAAVGIAVAVLAVVALNQPQSGQAAKAAFTPTSSAASLSPEISTSGVASSSVASSTHPSSSSTSTSKSTAGSTVASTAVTSAKAIPLVVLNATNRSGLAATAAQTFHNGGWTVTSQGNLDNDILSTCAYYDPSNPANQAAAQALMAQFPAIKRIKEKFDGLPSGPIVVVLTADYS
jgi:cytoskeletal protein RodZ